MKKQDFLIIGLIVFFGAIVSIGISKLFIGGEQAIQSVEVVQQVSGEFPEADKRFFNKDAFDPTQTISINDNQNTAPFEATKQ